MSEISCSARIRELSDEHYNQQISFADYRQQRREILDQLDEELNAADAESSEDSTKVSLLGKAVAFFRNDTLEEN